MERTTTNSYKPKPRWEMAQSSDYVDARTLESNNETFAFYFKTIYTVKSELLRLNPDLSYERDYTEDPVEGMPGAVHHFMTKTFYWYLTCDECQFFIIQYAFAECPFEAQIRKLLIPYGGSPFTTQIRLQTDIATNFKRTARLEDSKYFSQAR